MTVLKPPCIARNGKKEFAVLPYDDFVKIREELEDWQDLRCLREAEAAEADAPTIGLAELRRRLKAQALNRR